MNQPMKNNTNRITNQVLSRGNILNNARHLLEIALFIISATYLLGFIITNAYFLRYGFFCFDLIKLRYGMAGAIFVFMCLVPIIFMYYTGFLGMIKGLLENILLFVATASFSIALASIVFFGLKWGLLLSFGILNMSLFMSGLLMRIRTKGKAPLVFYILLLLSVIGIAIMEKLRLPLEEGEIYLFAWYYTCAIAIGFLSNHLRKETKKELPEYMYFTIHAILMLMILTSSFGVTVYSFIPIHFGGGKPANARIIVKEKSLDMLKDSSIEFEHGVTSKPLRLLDQDDQRVILMTSKSNQVVQIRSDIVMGIIFLGDKEENE